jgi:small-conductance mechanosensitive channel
MTVDVSGAIRTVQGMVNGLIALLPNLALAMVAFLLAVLVGRGVSTVVSRLTTRYQPGHRNLGLLMGRIAQWIILFIGLLVALAIAVPSFKPAQVIQLLGIIGLAIGFAFKDIFQNFLGGILLLLTQPFRIGDQIVTGGFEGTVEDIQTRATLIRTYDGRRVVIPNAVLFTGSVVVNTAFDTRRSEFNVGIGYGDDIEEAKRLIRDAIQGADGVLKDPAPDVLLVALADSTVDLRARWWSKPQRGEVLVVQDRVVSAIKKTLAEHGIDMPFPTQQILFHDQTEETDGDPSRQREGWPNTQSAPPKPRFLVTRRGHPTPDQPTPDQTERRDAPRGDSQR